MTLALLCQFTAQHVSDISTFIFRSLRLLGVLLCRLYCAVMTEVYVLIYLLTHKPHQVGLPLFNHILSIWLKLVVGDLRFFFFITHDWHET